MTRNIEMPWNATVEYLPFPAMTQEQGRSWFAFREWFDDLERYVVSVGIEGAGFAPTSEATRRYLWIEGLNDIVANDPAHIIERLAELPPFPRFWPDTYQAGEFVRLLDELQNLEELQFPEEDHLVLANDLREQAIKTLEKSQVFATL